MIKAVVSEWRENGFGFAVVAADQLQYRGKRVFIHNRVCCEDLVGNRWSRTKPQQASEIWLSGVEQGEKGLTAKRAYCPTCRTNIERCEAEEARKAADVRQSALALGVPIDAPCSHCGWQAKWEDHKVSLYPHEYAQTLHQQHLCGVRVHAPAGYVRLQKSHIGGISYDVCAFWRIGAGLSRGVSRDDDCVAFKKQATAVLAWAGLSGEALELVNNPQSPLWPLLIKRLGEILDAEDARQQQAQMAAAKPAKAGRLPTPSTACLAKRAIDLCGGEDNPIVVDHLLRDCEQDDAWQQALEFVREIGVTIADPDGLRALLRQASAVELPEGTIPDGEDEGDEENPFYGQDVGAYRFPDGSVILLMNRQWEQEAEEVFWDVSLQEAVDQVIDLADNC